MSLFPPLCSTNALLWVFDDGQLVRTEVDDGRELLILDVPLRSKLDGVKATWRSCGVLFGESGHAITCTLQGLFSDLKKQPAVRLTQLKRGSKEGVFKQERAG